MSIPAAVTSVAIGNAAGWALAFGADENEASPLIISSQDYYAEVEAELPADLKGGAYTFTIEGLTDEHYVRLVGLGQGESLGVVKLYLFWLDANESIGGYLENALGLTGALGALDESALGDSLVATLAIKRISREVGPRRYDTVVQGRELVYEQLSGRMPAPLVADSFSKALDAVAAATNASIKTYLDLPAASGNSPGSEEVSIPKGTTWAQALEQIARSVEQAAGQGGRGLALVRNGVLHFGLRPIPLDGGDSKPLTLRTGLLETRLAGVVDADPNHDPSTGMAPTRRQFKLTLKGRPDLKPGDLVAFAAPKEDVATTTPGIVQALLGSLAGDLAQELDAETLDTTLYITSVQHRLGRTSGFSTVLTGVQVSDGNDAWDRPTPSGARNAKRTGGAVGARASATGQLAHAIARGAVDAANAPEPLEIGEVISTHVSGTSEPPGQTVDVISGLDASDGRPNQARRLDLDRQNPRASSGVPYLTPFAWGRAGLVLPRYPGTRVALAYRHGEASDPVELGALWESGHGPDCDPGDWWLILPADPNNVSTADLSPGTAATEPNGHPATNDLIDANGDRFIEVGSLTIRLGQNGLGNAGERPQAGSSSDYISIEHDDGKTKVTIDQNGAITLHAAQDITLEAEQNLTIKAAQTLTFEADQIDAKAGTGMDVKQK